MKNNESLQQAVLEAIKWEPLLRDAHIGVSAIDGIITLTGVVDSYPKKHEAEHAAKNTAGVKGIVELIKIIPRSSVKKDDFELVTDILAAFEGNPELADYKVSVTVEHGWVTLDGELQWNFQKEAAMKDARETVGVTGITCNIKVKPVSQGEVEKKDIEAALMRNWSLRENDIKVTVSGNNIILAGTVHSLYQKEESEKIAWKAPDACHVYNELIIK